PAQPSSRPLRTSLLGLDYRALYPGSGLRQRSRLRTPRWHDYSGRQWRTARATLLWQQAQFMGLCHHTCRHRYHSLHIKFSWYLLTKANCARGCAELCPHSTIRLRKKVPGSQSSRSRAFLLGCACVTWSFLLLGGGVLVSELFREVDNCVTAPQGFRAGATSCGIKSDASIKDLAILLSDVPCIAAGTFTTSATRAAPVLICQKHLQGGKAQAVIVNSGNANCATGEQGLRNANRMTEFVAARFHVAKDLVLCSSTGIIGRQLPIEKIEAGVQEMELSKERGDAFSEAILTTDTRPKRMALEFQIDGR